MLCTVCYFYVIMKHMTKRTYTQIQEDNRRNFVKRLVLGKHFGLSWEEILAQAVKYDSRKNYHPQSCWVWDSTVFRRKRSARSPDREIPWFWVTDPVTGVRKQVYARRYAWYLVNGRELQNGHDGQWFGLFKCGNDRCVNPFHGQITSKDAWKYDANKLDPLEKEKRANQP